MSVKVIPRRPIGKNQSKLISVINEGNQCLPDYDWVDSDDFALEAINNPENIAYGRNIDDLTDREKNRSIRVEKQINKWNNIARSKNAQAFKDLLENNDLIYVVDGIEVTINDGYFKNLL